MTCEIENLLNNMCILTDHKISAISSPLSSTMLIPNKWPPIIPVTSLSQSPAAPVAHENDSDKDDDIEEMRFCKDNTTISWYEGLIRIQSTSDFINLISLSRGNDSFPTQLYENDDESEQKIESRS